MRVGVPWASIGFTHLAFALPALGAGAMSSITDTPQEMPGLAAPSH